jgi:hypothetical protein
MNSLLILAVELGFLRRIYFTVAVEFGFLTVDFDDSLRLSRAIKVSRVGTNFCANSPRFRDTADESCTAHDTVVQRRVQYVQ